MRSKLFHDILRDKGATKYSITKFLALVFSLILISYLSYYLFWLQIAVDHTLVIELMGLIGALVGLKNNWGIARKGNLNANASISLDAKVDTNVDDTKDDTEF